MYEVLKDFNLIFLIFKWLKDHYPDILMEMKEDENFGPKEWARNSLREKLVTFEKMEK